MTLSRRLAYLSASVSATAFALLALTGCGGGGGSHTGTPTTPLPSASPTATPTPISPNEPNLYQAAVSDQTVNTTNVNDLLNKGVFANQAYTAYESTDGVSKFYRAGEAQPFITTDDFKAKYGIYQCINPKISGPYACFMARWKATDYWCAAIFDLRDADKPEAQRKGLIFYKGNNKNTHYEDVSIDLAPNGNLSVFVKVARNHIEWASLNTNNSVWIDAAIQQIGAFNIIQNGTVIEPSAPMLCGNNLYFQLGAKSAAYIATLPLSAIPINVDGTNIPNMAETMQRIMPNSLTGGYYPSGSIQNTGTNFDGCVFYVAKSNSLIGTGDQIFMYDPSNNRTTFLPTNGGNLDNNDPADMGIRDGKLYVSFSGKARVNSENANLFSISCSMDSNRFITVDRPALLPANITTPDSNLQKLGSFYSSLSAN